MSYGDSNIYVTLYFLKMMRFIPKYSYIIDNYLE